METTTLTSEKRGLPHQMLRADARQRQQDGQGVQKFNLKKSNLLWL
jgi:hypothetical protein